MCNPNKYKIHLSEPERKGIKNISRNGQSPSKKILHAQMLLLSDQDYQEGGWTPNLRSVGGTPLHSDWSSQTRR